MERIAKKIVNGSSQLSPTESESETGEHIDGAS